MDRTHEMLNSTVRLAIDIEIEALKKNFDDFYLLISAVIISLMQPGFAMLEAGAVHSKNALNIIFKNCLDSFISAVGYFLVGYSLGYTRGNPFIGTEFFIGIGLPEHRLAHWFFQCIFANTAATIISGAVAERCHFVAYLAYSGLVSGVVYPIVSHWVWHEDGWLRQLGFVDFAGSGTVHALGGMCSLVGAILLGPRIGRFVGGKVVDMPGHSMPLVGIGELLLVSGFLAFNGGSQGHISEPGDGTVIARSMVNTLLGGSGAAVVALLIGRLGLFEAGPWPYYATVNASICGIVSVCAGCDAYSSFGALLCGAIATLIFCSIHHLMIKLKIDDPLDAVAVHLGGGTWGTLARPIIIREGILYTWSGSAFSNLAYNFIGIVAILAWSAACSLIIFGTLRVFGYLRVSEEVETKGLDASKHGEVSYPVGSWPASTPQNTPSVENIPTISSNGNTLEMKLTHRKPAAHTLEVDQSQL